MGLNYEGPAPGTPAADREADEAGDRWEAQQDERYHRSIGDTTPAEARAERMARRRQKRNYRGDWDG